MAEMGLAGLLVPEEFGGTQLSRLTGALIYEQLAQADMSTAVWLSVHNMVDRASSYASATSGSAAAGSPHDGGQGARRLLAERGARRLGCRQRPLRGAPRRRRLRRQRQRNTG